MPHSNISCDKSSRYNIQINNSSVFCGTCVKKIVKHDAYITCQQCSLDFHIKCIDISDVEKCNIWFCDCCFSKTCNQELPFSDCFIDLNCKLQKGLKITHVNIQSITNKIDHVNLLLHNNNIDVLCLTETWLSDSIDDSELKINNYSFCRLDRLNDKSHGGILCYVKDGISFKQNTDLYVSDVEALWIEINLPKTKPIIVGTVYRAPSCTVDYLEKVDSIFQKCNSIYDDIYILGDFNLDISKKCNIRKISSLARNSNTEQLIKEYTRITEKSKSILDLIFVSRPEFVVSSGVHSLGLSDHSLIYVVRKHKQIKLPPRVIKSRCFKNFNEIDFINTIQNTDWNCCCIDNVNTALSKWQTLFNKACNQHAPYKEKKVKGYLPEWINGEFLQLSKDRDFYYAKAHKTNNQADWNMARSLRNKVNNMKYYLKKNYCNEAVTKNMHDSKKLWKTIKKIIPSKSSNVPSVVNSESGLTNSSNDTANEFNKYFTSIGNTLGRKFENNGNVKCPCNHLCCEQNCSTNKFTFLEVTPDFVYKHICNMANDKSPGFDEFNAKLLKIAAPFISDCLAYICNLSLSESVFPDDWKKAKVTPIYKSGEKTDVGNYRPISVLPIVSKIIERAVHDQLYKYLNDTGKLSTAQSGFRANHSTTTTLLDVQDYVLNNMDSGYTTGLIFLDLKKAFDVVNHDILIDKLSKYGINQKELLWFKSYLNNRSQAVHVNSTLSNFENINIGIPQGSILGPLLFIIFVNCLPYAVNCKIVMYADDTTLMCRAKNEVDLQAQLESSLHNVAKWLEANKLILNVDKTKLMVLGTKHMLSKFNNVNLVYNNNVIEKVNEFKYLGVKFDSNMSWSSHFDYLSGNISKRIGIIRRVKHFLPHHTLVMLSNALVIPHFDYASSVWCNFSLEYQNKLQVLQNSLARTILSADIRTPVNDMFNSLKWIKLSDRWRNHMLILVFKCLRNLSPTYLTSKFEFVHSNHAHATRNQVSNTLIVPKFNSNSGLRTFHVRATYIWNNLSPAIRTEMENMTLGQYKTNVLIMYNL